jgi:hypothetical protein
VLPDGRAAGNKSLTALEKPRPFFYLHVQVTHVWLTDGKKVKAMWEWMRSEILEFVMDRLADTFSLSPLYPEEWSLMRFINAFLLACAVAFLLAAGVLGWPPFLIAAALLLIGAIARLAVWKLMK